MASEAKPSKLRGQQEPLLAWAKEAHAEGKSVHDIVTAVYGVDLPPEAYVFYKSRPRDPELPADLVFFPWELLRLTGLKYEDDTPDPWSIEQETHALAQNIDFLPLMKLGAFEARHDGYVIGYSISALREGKTTILGHNEDIPESGASFEQLGDSLLSVLYEWATDHLRMVNEQFKSPSNRGFGSLDNSDVERAAGILKSVETMQRKLAEQQATASSH
jgi:hypothetical protein